MFRILQTVFPTFIFHFQLFVFNFLSISSWSALSALISVRLSQSLLVGVITALSGIRPTPHLFSALISESIVLFVKLCMTIISSSKPSPSNFSATGSTPLMPAKETDRLIEIFFFNLFNLNFQRHKCKLCLAKSFVRKVVKHSKFFHIFTVNPYQA